MGWAESSLARRAAPGPLVSCRWPPAPTQKCRAQPLLRRAVALVLAERRDCVGMWLKSSGPFAARLASPCTNARVSGASLPRTSTCRCMRDAMAPCTCPLAAGLSTVTSGNHIARPLQRARLRAGRRATRPLGFTVLKGPNTADRAFELQTLRSLATGSAALQQYVASETLSRPSWRLRGARPTAPSAMWHAALCSACGASALAITSVFVTACSGRLHGPCSPTR